MQATVIQKGLVISYTTATLKEIIPRMSECKPT